MCYYVIEVKEKEVITMINQKDFTSVLDTIYNLGDPKKNHFPIKKHYQETFNYYYQLKDNLGTFDRVVMFALLNDLIDQNSGFWEDYFTDIQYNGTKNNQ